MQDDLQLVVLRLAKQDIWVDETSVAYARLSTVELWNASSLRCLQPLHEFIVLCKALETKLSEFFLATYACPVGFGVSFGEGVKLDGVN